jgi:hypothetical protein
MMARSTEWQNVMQECHENPGACSGRGLLLGDMTIRGVVVIPLLACLSLAFVLLHRAAEAAQAA